MEKLQKNDCLLHSPAKPLVIPIYAQTYPQNARSFPGSSHSALIFHSNFAEGVNSLMFMKNLTIAGGFLLLALTGPGAFSLDR
ncbi:DoxX family protein, partial [Salmonella enterica subsp. enterica serovar Montevideo]|nr:DoxX family protein [Salmonella enterica subsp. enterica serovar Montevideo]